MSPSPTNQIEVVTVPIWILRALRKHWKVVATLVVVGVLYFVFRHNEDNWSSRFTQLEKSHSTELLDISKARNLERAENEKNMFELQGRLKDVQQRYDDQVAQLAAKKKIIVKKIVAEANNDPAELAKRLSEVTGFRVEKTVEP